jgi:predicted GH43/DUF377 family glycosyl hydrolase
MRALAILLAVSALTTNAAQPWVKKGRILAPGFAGPPSENWLSAPSLVKLANGRLRMYFWGKAKDNTNYIFAAEALPNQPEKWTLISTQPMLGPAPGSDLNNFGPSFPWVVRRDEGPWLMYYCTWGSWAPKGQISNRTAVAVSSDAGLTWKIAKEPVLDLGKPGEWDSALSGSVAVLRRGSRAFDMWYTAGDYGPYDDGTRNLIAQIGHATSSDGLTWVKSKPNPVLAARKNAIPRFEAVISKPCVLRIGGKYHMWYSRRVNDGKGYRLAYARSTDGRNWERVIDENIFDYTPGGFDSENMSYPNVIEAGGQLLMFYVGNRFGATGIGLATMKKSELR